MAFTMPLAASIVFVGKWPRLQTKGQGTGPCPASSFFVTFEIILNSAKLLQVPHGQAGHESLRTEENQPHQSLRLQVHQRARKVDKDGKALSAEHLHAQHIISEPLRAH